MTFFTFVQKNFMNKRVFQLAAVLCLLTLAACHSTKNTTKAKVVEKNEAELTLIRFFQREWTLIQLTGFAKSEIDKLESQKPVLNITETINGFGGCNRLTGGQYKLKGNSVSISNLASTKKMCVGTGQKVETALLSILNNVHSYKMEGVKLYLYTNDNRQAEFIAFDKE